MNINSIKFAGSIVAVLVFATVAVMFSATTVRADEYGDYGGFAEYGDYGGYSDYSDYGGYADYGDYGGYTDYADYGGYSDYSDYGGYTDYSDYGAYSDYSDYGAYSGYNDYGAYSGYEDYGGYDIAAVDEVYDVYDVYEIQDGVAYSEQSYGGGSSGCGSCGGGGYGGGSSFGGGGFSMPSFGRAPSTSYSYPAPQPQRPVQQQQQQQQQQQAQPINIVNTNNNNNVNTNTNTNTSQVIPVYQTPVTYPVQYVYPQQPVYPTYPTYPSYNPAPFCTITVTGGYAGGMVALSWSSSNATSAYISPSVGAVAPNGSTSVYAYGNNVYTLTVTGPGGTNTCRTTGYFPTSSISLSQIPYTGFDAGLLGNAMYWLSLISFAVAGSYLALYYKGGAMTLVGSMLGSRQARTSNVVMHETVRVPEEVETKIEIVEAPVETMTPSPIDVMENLPVAPTANATMDSMQVMHSKEGAAPRIVITRN